jgi:serine/threonine protein kinase
MKGYPPPVIQNGKSVIDGTIISIDNIRLDGVLGSGANGFVFSGTDLWLDRPVAVKVWPPRRDRSHANNDRADQAIAEARKIAQFKDKRIASIYRVDRLADSGWVYAVMEYIEGEPLANVRASLSDDSGFLTRCGVWDNVFEGLDAAERGGVYHGDVHGGNVIVTSFFGDSVLIDFGTSILARKGHSMRRHATTVNEFVRWLLPEFEKYIKPFDIPNLVTPEYATIAVNQWVEAASELQKLEQSLAEIPEPELGRLLRLLASRTSSTHININKPVVRWLRSKGISDECLDIYVLAAKGVLASRWKHRQKWPSGIGLPARPVPPTRTWLSPDWIRQIEATPGIKFFPRSSSS